MQNDQFIKVRVPAKLKQEFAEICDAIGEQPTTYVREIIQQWVTENKRRLGERVVVSIRKPAGYDLGAWKVTVKLRDPDEGAAAGAQIPFEFPEWNKRLLRSDKDFVAVVPGKARFTSKLGGRFVDGAWHGHLYSNGCPEDENPTPIDVVAEELRARIEQTLDGTHRTVREDF